MTIDTNIAGSGGVVPIIGDGWVQLGGNDSPKVTWDELSQAEQDLVIQYILSSQTPSLQPPVQVEASTNDISGAGAALQILSVDGDRSHEVISSMLDAWLENIKQINDEKVHADIKKQEEQREINRQLDGLSNVNTAYQAAVNTTEDPNFSGVTLGIIITGVGITEVMMNVNDVAQGVNPVQNMAQKTIAPLSNDLSMAMPVFCMCAVYQAAVQVMATEGVSEDTQIDMNFAKKFAENILGMVGSASFNGFLSALITSGVAKGEPVTPERMNQLQASLKLVLLSAALALVYTAEAGRMTGKEFFAMLKGEMTFPEGDVRNDLIAAIHTQLAEMSPEDAKMILTALNSFFDDNPSLETLANPATVFAGINKTVNRGPIIA